jgi:hypothetical protein
MFGWKAAMARGRTTKDERLKKASEEKFAPKEKCAQGRREWRWRQE